MAASSDITLAIETSNPSAWTPASPIKPGVVVAADRGQTLLARADIDPQAVHQDQLMSSIAAAMSVAGIAPRQLSTVAVSVGPGGYTAVRLGVTVAKIIAEVTGAACKAVPTAHAIVRATAPGVPCAVALASKGTTAFLTRFDAAGVEQEPGLLCTAAWIESAAIEVLIADAFLPESFANACKERGIRIMPPVFDALHVAQVAAGLAAVDPLSLAAFYPREPEAVTKWKQLKQGTKPA
jgi:tRNA threonylcarbamoyladenosine biosynthesis protein TsaB